MKSRFNVLTSLSDRRNMAVSRSGGAVGILLTVLALSTLQTGSRTQESMPIDMFAMEIGASEPDQVKEFALASLPQHVADRTNSTHHTSTPDDEFGFGPYDTAEPTGY